MKEYITQEQAEKIAHRRATKYAHRTAPLYCSYAFVPHTLMDFVRDIEAAAIQHYRDSLVAGVVLPEPVAHVSSLQSGSPLMLGLDEWHRQGLVGLHTADQLRQAIADALAKREPDYEQSETYLRTQSELAKQVPQGYKLVPETPTNDMTVAMANALEDPENERSSWDLAENMYAAMLAAVPAQQVTRAPMFEFRECEDSQAAAPDPKEGA